MNIQIHNPKKGKKAVLYRSVTDKHICPFGLKSRDLLTRNGYKVEDHTFESKEESTKFREERGLETTPQTYINGERIGGYDDLRAHFGKEREQNKKDETSFTPVLAVFAAGLLFAAAVNWRATGSLQWLPMLEMFVAFSMSILAVQKLRDLFAFSNSFLGYDLLAQKWVPYSYVYPYVELLAGVAMLTSVPTLILVSAPLSLFIGAVGAISVFKAVYIDKRELKCACAGGNTNVPLGFVSLSENLAMVGMGAWMLIKHLG